MRTRIAILVGMLLVVGAALLAPPARASTSVSVSFFYDSLAPYGQWMVSAEHGYVWRPARVSVGWRPYSDGQWVYTDYGWTMLSDEPWGWAAYHYGRWYVDPYYGWVWVPGVEWSPAWVSFYQGSGFIGWAPLPPGVSVGVNVRLDPRSYCFVNERHFADRSVGRWIAPSVQNVTLVRSSVNITRYSRSGDRWINRSVPVERIERVTERRIAPRRISDVIESRSVPRPEVRSDRVTLFRPQIDARATHAPERVVDLRPQATRREAPARGSSPQQGGSWNTSRSYPGAAASASSHGKSASQKSAQGKKKSPPPPHH